MESRVLPESAGKMDVWVKIGARLRKERIKRGMTMEYISELIDLTPNAYRLIEKGKRGTNINNLFFLCRYFGISIDEFMSGQQSGSGDALKPSIAGLLTAYENGFIEEISRFLVSRRHNKKQLDALAESMMFQSHQLEKLFADE